MGNVLVTISDRHIAQDVHIPANGTDFYLADRLSATDYYAFGQPMPGRQFTLAGSTAYRFGFNGKENEREWGNNGIQDFGARMYSGHLGRWLSRDPLAAKYASWSPYVGTINNPIFYEDGDGREVIAPTVEARDLVLNALSLAFGKDNGFSFNGDKLVHNGNKPQLSPGRSIMFEYAKMGLVDSETPIYINANVPPPNEPLKSTRLFIPLLTRLDKMDVESDGAVTAPFSAGKAIKDVDQGDIGYDQMSIVQSPFIILALGSKLVKTKQINVAYEDGVSPKSIEGTVLHELGHAIVEVIMLEHKGVYNGVDFNTMTENQRSDWAIKFTNTLNKDNKQTLETGEGQHGRGSFKDKTEKNRVKEQVKPLEK